MFIQDKTNEELQQELLELRQEMNSLKILSGNGNTKSKSPESMTGEISSRLEYALQGGNMAWWEMDILTGNVNFAKRKTDMLGYSPEKFTHYRDFVALVHPQDFERVMNAMRGHFEGVYDYYEAEYRILAKSGKYISFYDYGTVVKKDTDGKPLIITGFVYDITDKKKAEERSLKSENMLQTVLDNFPGVVFWKDKDSIYLGCNQSFAEGSGLKSPAEIDGKTDFEMPWASTEAINYVEVDKAVMESGNGRLHIIETQHQSDGQIIWLDTSKLPMRDSSGKVIGVIGVSSDITMLKTTEQELINTNIELDFQNKEKEKRSTELFIANKELIFQINELSMAELALKESEERFRTIFENSTIGIYRTTPEGQILLVNPTLIKLLGYSSFEELAYRNLKEDGFEPSYDRTFFMDVLKKDGVVKGLESAWTKMNGTLLYVSESAKAIYDKKGKIIYYDGVVEDISLRKQAEEMLTHSNEQLSNFASNLQLVREEERLNLAREIHDSLAQFLVALKMDMGMYKNKISKTKEVINPEGVIDEMVQLMIQVDNANKSARSIMNGLRPEQLEVLGFVAAAEAHLHTFEQTHHIKCSFKNTVLDINIHHNIALALFRILQESLNNILKHAMATRVSVQLTNVADKLVMEISDNGTGFDVNHAGRTDSYGLIGMKERIKLLDGHLNITSKVGEGTTVNVEIHYGA